MRIQDSMRKYFKVLPIFTTIILSACGSSGTDSDSDGDSDNPESSAPQILTNYQADTSAEALESLVFRVEAADSESSNLDFVWRTSAGSFSASTETNQAGSITSEISWTAPACSNDPIDISVDVTDADSESVTYTFTSVTTATCLAEEPESSPPQILSNFQADTSADALEILVFRVEATDSESSNLDFVWTTSAGSYSASTETNQASSVTSEVSWTAPACSNDPIEISVAVTDAEAESVTYIFSPVTTATCLAEEPESSPPQILSNYQADTSAETLETLVFRVEATDSESSNLDFVWHTSAGSFSASTVTNQASSETSEVSWTAPTCSNDPIEVSVDVIGADSESVTFTFTSVTTALCSAGGIQPEIEITRTSGEIPFHVYVSSSGSTATDVEFPYDQLEYSWDFGDTISEGSFVHPVTLNTVEANTDQTGPEASFVYRNPGTYNITLTAQYSNGVDTFVNETTTSVTVSDWSGETRYLDPDSGNNSNTGTTSDAAWKTWSTLVSWLSEGDNRKGLIKRGTEVSVEEILRMENSHVRLSAYGEGAKPILTADGEIGSFIRLASSTTIEDHVYSGLHLDGNSGNAPSLIYARIFEVNAVMRAVAFLDMTFENDDPHGAEDVTSNMITIQNPPDGYIDDVLVWNSNFIRNHSVKNGIYAEIQGHFAVVGSSFSGGDGNSIKDHPIYPATVNHAHFRWIDFQETFSNNFSINNASKGGVTLHYTLVDGSNITGGQNGLDFTKHNGSTTGWFSDVIVQNNAIHDLGSPSQGYGIIGGSLERFTIRDNRFYGNPYTDILIEKDGDHDISLQMYDNLIWKGADPASSLAMLDFRNILDLAMSENVFVNEGVSGGSTNIGSFDIPEIINWNVDDNQYWAPGISTPFKVQGVGSYSFIEWQGLGYDISGSNSDPGFVIPENGDF